MGGPIEPCTAGISVLDVLRTLEQMHGSEVVHTALARLPEAQRREIESVTAVSWLPNSIMGAAIDEIARVANREPESMLDEAIPKAVARTFGSVWRVFLRITTDAALVARTPTIYSRSRNVGRLDARVVEPGKAEAVLTEWPDVSDRQLRTIGIGIAAVIELAGRKDVRHTAHRKPHGAVYQIYWRA